MRRRHTMSIREFGDYKAPSMLGSAANERGSKRLTMFTDPVSKEVIFQVASGSQLREHVEFEAALEDYNGIDI